MEDCPVGAVGLASPVRINKTARKEDERMTKKVVGKQMVDYISKRSGQPVTGVTLHLLGTSSRVEGFECETVFVSSKSPMYAQCMEYPLESEVSISYNRYGSVDTISPIKK